MSDTPRNVTCLALTLCCHALPAVEVPQDWEAELDRTVDELLETHPEPYHRVSPSEFDRAVSELRLSLPELEDHAVVVELMRLVARIGDGHTRYDSENGSHGFARLFPAVTYADADGLHVLAATAEHADLDTGVVGSDDYSGLVQVIRVYRALVESDSDLEHQALEELIERHADGEMIRWLANREVGEDEK